MSSTIITQRKPESSPQPRGRLTGVVYLLYFLMAILAQLLTGRNFDFFANATNLISIGFYLALTLLFYGMFKPVSRGLSLLAALFSLAGCVVMGLGIFPATTLPVNPLLFFGPYCLLIGYLVFRSTFLPRILGVLMALAGLGWLAFLSPSIVQHLAIYIEGLGILAEASLMLWLIVKGVNLQRWNEQASKGMKAALRHSSAPTELSWTD
jgi:hypothetical protein